MQDNNGDSLALAMTNTWFSMLPKDLKTRYFHILLKKSKHI